MTEALRAYDYDDSPTETDSGEDLATAYLDSQSALQTEQEQRAIDDSGPLIPTDWLTLLTPKPPAEPDLDEPPAPLATPAGMAGHLAPPRMRPTLGARLRSVLGKGVLALVLAAVAAAALTGGAYVLLSSAWLDTASQAPATAPQPQQAPAPVSANPPQAGSQDQQGEPLSPPAKVPGSDFTQLRDQGIKELKAGHYDRAIQILENASAVNETDAVTEYQLGLAYMGVQDREHAAEDAEMAFRSAISLQPTWAAPYMLLAESLVRQGNYAGAIDPANEAVQIDPSKAEAWMTLGRAYQGAGRQSDATKAFAQAARLSPAPPAAP